MFLVAEFILKSLLHFRNTHNGVAMTQNSLNSGYEKSQQRIAYYMKESVH